MSMRYHKNEVSVCFSPLQSPRKRQEDAQEPSGESLTQASGDHGHSSGHRKRQEDAQKPSGESLTQAAGDHGRGQRRD